MFPIDQLTEEQFIRPATLEAIKHEVADLIDHLMAPEGAKLADQIDQKLAIPGLETRAPKEILQQYQLLSIYLKFMAVICVDNDTLLNLVQNYYLDSLDAGLDMNERMTGKMYTIPALVWPDYAVQLIHALKQNTQKIGERPVLKTGETAPSPPTIQNWLSDYDRNLGPEKIDNLEREEYLAKNQNASMLNEQDKAKLRNVLQFYDNLKPIPSSIISKMADDLATEEELEEEPIESIFPAPPIQVPKRYVQPKPIVGDKYLESIEASEPQSSFPSFPQSPPQLRRDETTMPPPLPQPFPQPRPTPMPPSQPQPADQPPQSAPADYIKNYYGQLAQPSSAQGYGGQAISPAPPADKYKGQAQPQRPTPTPQPQYPPSNFQQQSYPSSPQMRGGAPSETEGRRGVENIPSTPPSFPSSAEEGRRTYPVYQPPIQPPPQPKPIQQPQGPYLEPIDVPDIAPKQQAPKQPEPDPRLQGNIIDLKNRDN